MQFISNLVDSMTTTVRFIVGAIMLCSFGFGLLMTFGLTYVAPKVADNYAERAEAFGDRALAVAQEESRNRELAKDGWGYGAPSGTEGSSRSADGEAVGGWGEGGD